MSATRPTLSKSEYLDKYLNPPPGDPPTEVAADLGDDIAQIFEDAYDESGDMLAALREVENVLGSSTEQAQAYARERSGELITGIDETTRDAIQNMIEAAQAEGLSDAELADSLETAFALSPQRAELIARTENQTAFNMGTLQALMDAGEEYVVVSDPDLCGEEVCNVDGETWTIEEAQAEPLGHPNCGRMFRPLTAEELAEVLAEEPGDSAVALAADPDFESKHPRNEKGEFEDGSVEGPVPRSRWAKIGDVVRVVNGTMTGRVTHIAANQSIPAATVVWDNPKYPGTSGRHTITTLVVVGGKKFAFDESLHPRVPSGSPGGGEFTDAEGGGVQVAPDAAGIGPNAWLVGGGAGWNEAQLVTLNANKQAVLDEAAHLKTLGYDPIDARQVAELRVINGETHAEAIKASMEASQQALKEEAAKNAWITGTWSPYYKGVLNDNKELVLKETERLKALGVAADVAPTMAEGNVIDGNTPDQIAEKSYAEKEAEDEELSDEDALQAEHDARHADVSDSLATDPPEVADSIAAEWAAWQQGDDERWGHDGFDRYDAIKRLEESGYSHSDAVGILEAVKHYTASGAEDINSKLWHGEHLSEGDKNFVGKLNAYIAAIPPYPGEEPLSRGTFVSQATWEKLTETGVFTSKGYFSASSKEEVSKNFLPYGTDVRHSTLFVVDRHATGRSVEPNSDNGGELEVIFRPGTSFAIQSIEDRGARDPLRQGGGSKARYVIHLKEIPPWKVPDPRQRSLFQPGMEGFHFPVKRTYK